MEKLKLNQNQFSVGQADVTTGHVLKKDLSLYRNGESANEVFDIFENFDDAMEYVKQKMEENSTIEYWITNSKDEILFHESAFKNK